MTRRAASLARLTDELRNTLPFAIRRFTRVANYKQGTLVIETSSKKAMLDLTLNREKILKTIRKTIPKLENISITVNDNLSHSNEVLPARGVSPGGADILSSIAQMFEGELKDSLLRLASHKIKS
jgi:Uncharacterized protein conserved in bacteria